VPKENLIGEVGFGFTFAMKTLAGGRIGIASQALGIASGAYELSLRYSKEEKHRTRLPITQIIALSGR
jgi:alkylation response protein AidB-like acyl-CoA dehydrogenase